MYSVTRLLDVPADDQDRILRDIRARTGGATYRIVAPTMPGSRNGGDMLVHLRFPSEREWRSSQQDFEDALADPVINRVNGANYTGSPVHTDTVGGTVYRTLLLRVNPAVSTETLARFEYELRSMSRYVQTITSWQLSRAEESVGATTWTHVFEQEFTDIEGLAGPYLMHPVHWAMVDRWFDPECPDVIVRERVCHSFCALPDC
ncbi:Dabb family protein [Mycobacterium vicinigordonae]|uniref:Dabb family protein n=1 Tax=Mycobacterium vicinigordonae TaxID=1719132 RepID=UPI001FED0064|nr:Dabb family protein [Mycobacterium vicinigordonae]